MKVLLSASIVCLAASILTFHCQTSMAKEGSAEKVSIKTLGLQREIKTIAGEGRAVIVLNNGKRFQGVYLSKIASNTREYASGLRPKDIIVSVNGKTTKDPASVDKLIEESTDNTVKIKIIRAKKTSIEVLELLSKSRSKSKHKYAGMPVISLKVARPLRTDENSSANSMVEEKQTSIEEKETNSAFNLESYMIELVNKEREQRGLSKLTESKALNDVARAHSSDMSQRKFFSHIAPDGKTPADRVQNAGIQYSFLSENICTESWNESQKKLVKRAHKSLMKSPHHRENILRPGIQSIGIGISPRVEGGLNVTELFAAGLRE